MVLSQKQIYLTCGHVYDQDRAHNCMFKKENIQRKSTFFLSKMDFKKQDSNIR